MTLIEHLRAVAASLRDFDHAPDHIEVDTRAVSALLTDAANAIESTTKERDAARAALDAASAAHAADMASALEAANDGLKVLTREALDHYAAAKKRMEAEALVAIDTIARERDAARAEVARLLALATGPKINDEVE